MTQEEKDLLLKDLGGRLSYKVKVTTTNAAVKFGVISGISIENKISVRTKRADIVFNCTEVRPYLFPLSSMTEEQFMELKVFADLIYEGNTLELVGWNDNCKTLEFWLEEVPSYHVIKVFDWLNKNHFDYRGLIPMGLATDCTNLNIY